ncbi:MAG: PKD domain-containing protein [bacterium]|nr:PKD domain-containing protein [bacterium]
MDIYKKSLLVLFLLVMFPIASHAEVSKVVFTTEPQTVKPGEISGTITIQLQNSAGSLDKAAETVDVEFLSSSVSGAFLSPSSENPVTKTISTGSANKNFRYRDSTNGTFTITINATGRTSGQIWSANQAITISNVLPASTTTTVSAEESSSTTSSSGNQESSSSSSGFSSSHYGAAVLSSLKNSPGFEVNAGRNRLGTAGSPLEFKVETNIDYTNNSIFVWNFGDGSEGVGEIVNHTYTYPGEYVLVLNVSGPKGKAVSRANVKIVNPEFVVTHVSKERIEITNNSKSEVSLFGRALVTKDQIFAFPKDTIMKPGQKISFGANVTGLTPSEQSEISLMIVGTEFKLQEIMIKVEEQRLDKIAQVRSQLSVLQQQLTALSSQQNIAKSTKVIKNPVIDEPVVKELVETEIDESQTASAIDAITVEESSGIIKNWLQTLKRFFFRTEQ